MSSVAIAHFARVEVEDAYEHRDEHVLVVAFASEAAVHLRYDLRRAVDVGCEAAEERACDSHYQGSRNPLPADVANAEEQLVFAYGEIEQVASDLLCRNDNTMGAQVRIVLEWWEVRRQHCHLDVACDVELALYALLLIAKVEHADDVLGGVVDYEYQQRQANQHHESYYQADTLQLGVDNIVRDDD